MKQQQRIDKPDYVLRQCLHLLDNLTTDDAKIQKEIDGVTGEIQAMINQCEFGNEALAIAAIKMTIGPRIDNIVTQIVSKK